MTVKYEKVWELTSEGFTQREFADELGFVNHKIVWNLLYRWTS